MISISLCMIVKNEEAVIGRRLDSVRRIADEINIVDTGSVDQTKDIGARYTDRIFDFEWIDDFAAARNFSFQQATADYILWLDADDVFTEKDQELFLELKRTLDPHIDAVSMNYHLAFDEEGNVTSSLRRYRLVKRERGFKWIGAVHEYLEVYGNLQHSDASRFLICRLAMTLTEICEFMKTWPRQGRIFRQEIYFTMQTSCVITEK